MSHVRQFVPYAAAVLVSAILVSATMGEEKRPASTFNAQNFIAGEDCRWKSEAPAGLTVYGRDDAYIAAPGPEQNRAEWLADLRRYRQDMRDGKRRAEVLELDYKGVRAWVRLAVPLARALDLRPGDRLSVAVEARRVRGNGTLCFALDHNRREDERHAGWSGVVATAAVPDDGAWHRLVASIEVPPADTGPVFLRPIIGMDATHDASPGQVEIRAIDLGVPDAGRTDAMRKLEHVTRPTPLVRTLYDEPAQAWMQGAFTTHFTFMYDRGFYNPDRGGYQLDALLDDGEREFGGYDILLLWHAYPRIGLDGRNQLDFYRDMPGGLPAIRSLVDRAHARGVRVFINYNPWDTGTQRENRSDEDFLVELVARTDMDGIFLDTMVGDSPLLRAKLEKARPGVSLTPEGNPSIQNLSLCNGSWAQWLDDARPPGLDHRKWIEPRHMRWQIWRWNTSHREEIRRAFFNGSGMLVWENVFGVPNRWTAADRRLWRRAVAILRQFRTVFVSDAWEPFVQPAGNGEGLYKNSGGLFVHKWPGDGVNVYTVYMKEVAAEMHPWPESPTFPVMDVPLVNEPTDPGVRYFDLWNGQPARTSQRDGQTIVHGFVDFRSGLACIASIRKDRIDDAFRTFLERQRRQANTPVPPDDHRGLPQSVIEPKPVARTAPAGSERLPAHMVRVPGGNVRMRIEHVRRECGCYPDPETPFDQWTRFTWGHPFEGRITHDYTVEVSPFLIDDAAVTNADFKRFLEDSGYRPEHSENFLKHWNGGIMPAELADHPVVYVDLGDARAYAQWAGKRLPTEPEWQLAAQGTDGRKWPWGDRFDETRPDPTRVNTTGATLPVRALPEGRSPYGCWQMSGNVYELTESERDDGFTRFCIIRGGSCTKAEGSVWYMDGGPRPCDHHAKFILLWPGLDRCSTVGFRCVVDVQRVER